MNIEEQDSVVVLDQRIPPALFLTPNKEMKVFESSELSANAKVVYIELLRIKRFRIRVDESIQDYIAKRTKGLTDELVESALKELEAANIISMSVNESHLIINVRR